MTSSWHPDTFYSVHHLESVHYKFVNWDAATDLELFLMLRWSESHDNEGTLGEEQTDLLWYPVQCTFSLACCLSVDTVGTAVVWMFSGLGGIFNCGAGSVDKSPPC